MEVLSNKEIYVLLKILNDKKVKEGSSSIIEVDKNFSLKELEHIQNEVALAENKAPEEVLTIENTYKNMFGQSFHSGYKLNIVSIEAISNYAVEYVQALAQDNLSGLSDENKLSLLMEEFYSSAKNTSDYDNFVVDKIKYMPVVLFAYINDLVKLKTITNKKYDLRRDLHQDCLMENPAFNEAMDNLLDIVATMNTFEFMSNYNDYFNSVDSDRQANLENMRGFISSIISMQFGKKTKSDSSRGNHSAKPTSLSEQQWMIWFCIDWYIQHSNVKPSDFTIMMNSRLFEINKVSKDYKKPSDKVISEFNKKIWDIIKEPREEKERLIVPQKNDMYIINLQLYRRFSSTAQMNPELQNNMVVNMNLKRQIDLITKNYQSCTNGKTS